MATKIFTPAIFAGQTSQLEFKLGEWTRRLEIYNHNLREELSLLRNKDY